MSQHFLLRHITLLLNRDVLAYLIWIELDLLDDPLDLYAPLVHLLGGRHEGAHQSVLDPLLTFELHVSVPFLGLLEILLLPHDQTVGVKEILLDVDVVERVLKLVILTVVYASWLPGLRST